MIKAKSIEELNLKSGLKYGIAHMEIQINFWQEFLETEDLSEMEIKKYKRKIDKYNDMIQALEKLYLEMEN